MAYRSFFKWMFDGDLKSPLPNYVDARKGKISVADNISPINQHFLIKLFINNANINSYFDKYLNNIYLWSIPKEELMLFVKKCAYDFKVSRRTIPFFPRKENKTKLFNALTSKFPLLKNYEIDYLCDVIESSSNKNSIYATLGLDVSKKKKVNKKNKKSKQNSSFLTTENETKLSLDEFIANNFKLKQI